MVPRPAASEFEVARRLIGQGQSPAALGHLIECLAADRGGEAEAGLLGRLLSNFSVSLNPVLASALRRVCAIETIDLQPFARCLADAVLSDPAWRRISANADALSWAPEDVRAVVGGFAPRLMARCVNRSLAIERDGLALRRALMAVGSVDPAEDRFELAMALAIQAANNEYAWPESMAELESLARFEAQPMSTPWDMLRWAMYRSPTSRGTRLDRDRAGAVLAASSLARLAAATLPSAEEAELGAAMPGLAPSHDPVSDRVRAQYEDNPYPRWLSFSRPVPGERRIALLRRLPPGQAERFRGHLDVLIAGCGTGRQAIVAWHGYGVPRRMLAIDLSVASLAYAARMARRFDGAALEFMQADILSLDTFDRRFDIIEAIGVLHHLHDPMQGWRRLAARLKPGGAMFVAIYSERARADVVAARAEIAALGLPADASGVRRLRRLVLDAPADSGGWRGSLPRFGDFFSTSGCRDLVFHVQEHRFSPAGIAGALRALGLDFLGFDVAGPILAKFRRHYPSPASLLDLACWERFETDNPATFAGMMTFWCRRPD